MLYNLDWLLHFQAAPILITNSSSFCLFHPDKENLPFLHVSYTTIGKNQVKRSPVPKNHQKIAVRVLYSKLLDMMGIDDSLDERRYPYKLERNQYPVSFTHSNNKCAVVISNSTDVMVSVDIEENQVPWKICQRFFCSNEITLLSNLPRKNRQKLCNILWQAKECLIKIEQTTLMIGLSVDFSQIITEILREGNYRYKGEGKEVKNKNRDERYIDIVLTERAKIYTLYINTLLQIVILF